MHLYTGQEAIAVGVCANLRNTDFIFSTHRNHGHYLAKGGDMKALMAELYGKETGCSRGRGGSMHTVDVKAGMMGSSAIVAGTIPIAVGVALAFLHLNGRRVSVAFFGDGATNEGVFYEALNFAALRKLPIIFICENNGYSTHMSIKDCLASTNIAQKSKAFNMQGYKIDGNCAVEVYQTVYDAVNLARRNGGTTLIECSTYRWHGHVGASDDLDKLRSKEEHQEWLMKDPINEHRNLLLSFELIDDKGIEKVWADSKREVEEALVFAKASEYPH